MTEIELEPNDREDLLQLLDYALLKKLEEPQGRWGMGNYWKIRIPQLKMIVKGYKVNNIYKSSMGGLVGDIEDEINENTN
jgi:hypothetical protein